MGFPVPVMIPSGDHVHGIDSFHERYGDSSQQEVNEGILISDLAKGNMDFELGDVISKQ